MNLVWSYYLELNQTPKPPAEDAKSFLVLCCHNFKFKYVAVFFTVVHVQNAYSPLCEHVCTLTVKSYCVFALIGIKA